MYRRKNNIIRHARVSWSEEQNKKKKREKTICTRSDDRRRIMEVCQTHNSNDMTRIMLYDVLL